MMATQFTNIIVVQSLSPSEQQTGVQLKDEIESINLTFNRGIVTTIVLIDSRDELLVLLVDLTKAAKLYGIRPILHLECHGYDDRSGLALNQGGFDWKELKVPLAALNKATKFNLIIVAVACHGARIAHTISAVDESPFFAFIGPTDELDAPDLSRSFASFYRELFSSGNSSRALDKVNKELAPDEPPYYLNTSEQMFRLAYRRHILEHCTPERMIQRAGFISSSIKQLNPSSAMDPEQVKIILDARQKEFFERFYDRFFMIRDLPENRLRFKMRFEDFSDEFALAKAST